MFKVEKLVDGLMRTVNVSAINPHLTTWHSDTEVAGKVVKYFFSIFMFLEYLQFHQRESG